MGSSGLLRFMRKASISSSVVKQGCPLSAALYVLAINPLLKLINKDINIKGYCFNDGYTVTAMAYADDVTVIIRNQDELDRLFFHLKQYELASGAKLNPEKTEGVWFGSSLQKPKINIQVNDETKVLGIWINKGDPCLSNWSKKECEIKEEVAKWENKNTNYKARVNIVKTHIVSKLLFLATMTKMGFEIDNNIQAIKYGLFKEKMYDSKRRLFWLIMCVINTHIWKTRAKVVIEQKMIDSVAVCKNILTDLRRRK
uniref:Reverse transcriptase domain-containing protein n=1 Tax=Pundamilia nyererei TaxID=303518 RepID=A0A3B4HBB0_9CICH